MSKAATLLSIALALAATSPSLARTNHQERGAAQRPAAPSFEPPRIIEISPGVFVGSYQCAGARGRSCDSGI